MASSVVRIYKYIIHAAATLTHTYVVRVVSGLGPLNMWSRVRFSAHVYENTQFGKEL